MTKEAKSLIKHNITLYLAQKGINLYKPFRCVNPKHEDVHPSMRYDPAREKCHCFSCGADYDLFDLISIEYGLSGQAIFDKAEELYGQPADTSYAWGCSTVNTGPNVSCATTSGSDQFETVPSVKCANLDNFFAQAYACIDDTDYWKQRGLSRKTIDRFRIGYIKEWRHPAMPTSPLSPRLIIPTGKNSYFARDTRSDLTDEQMKYAKSKYGFQFFNIEALNVADQPIFLVEGELDALSILDCGGCAISLGSVSNAKAFASQLSCNPSQPIIIVMDNDARGKKTAKLLSESFSAIGIPFQQSTVPDGFKDPNELLCSDRDKFIAWMNSQITRSDKLSPDTSHSHLKRASDVNILEERPICVPTGMKLLDSSIGGGLYGLTVIGGISSVGKSTFVAQIADQIAQNGTPVGIISLEMSAAELCRKSIARISFRGDHAVGKSLTATDIRMQSKHLQHNREHYEECVGVFRNFGSRIFFYDEMHPHTIDGIQGFMQEVCAATDTTPVFVIDYLQLLSSGDYGLSDKQNIDRIMAALMGFVKVYKTPIIAISSLSRAAYNLPISREAFKESGAIEYAADILLGIQYTGVGTKGFDPLEASNESPRAITISVLKNRLNRAGKRIQYLYHAGNDFFEEKD